MLIVMQSVVEVGAMHRGRGLNPSHNTTVICFRRQCCLCRPGKAYLLLKSEINTHQVCRFPILYTHPIYLVVSRDKHLQ